MRTRIVTSSSFSGDRVIGAILFEDTVNREVEGKPTANYLWEEKGVVPFLKCDKGLVAEENGVQLMKPNPGLDDMMAKAAAGGVIFGTKMRSVIKQANAEGVKAIVAQQFEEAKRIIAHGLVPIVEPEVDIKCADKAEAEKMLHAELSAHVEQLAPDQRICLKLTLPEDPTLYNSFVGHPNVVRMLALSGGYSREEANERLARCKGTSASFSRALAEGLTKQQTQEEFDATLKATIDSVFMASST